MENERKKRDGNVHKIAPSGAPSASTASIEAHLVLVCGLYSSSRNHCPPTTGGAAPGRCAGGSAPWERKQISLRSVPEMKAVVGLLGLPGV